tara:strand:- start:643 stop:993 length:351 start_codon:yes stop_codon:yes gene_type:complete
MSSLYVECEVCAEKCGVWDGVCRCKGDDPKGVAFTLEDAGPAHDTPRKRGARTIYVDGPNGKGDNGSHIEVFGPDRDAFANLLLSMFGAEEVKPETEAERLERFKRSLGIKGGDDE